MIREVLSPELVTVDLQGHDKRTVITALVDLLVAAGKVNDREGAISAVMDHENHTSTGMEHGIAIPHAKTDIVSELVACIGITRHKVDFECLDRKPAQIFVLTLSPSDGTGPHVRFLADISRLLKEKKFRKRILSAKTDQELLEAFTAPA
jgi:PTS system nitrogen regulatory IIA component